MTPFHYVLLALTSGLLASTGYLVWVLWQCYREEAE